MRQYTIRITDSYGVPRYITMPARSAVEALRNIEPADGEIVEEIVERS